MKNRILLIMLSLSLSIGSCASIFGPAEPDTTDELEPRVEPESYDSKYPRGMEEKIESDVNPLDTEMMEQQPLIK
jgi:hypothetical protein